MAERKYSEADWIAYAAEPDYFPRWLGSFWAGWIAAERGAGAGECPWRDDLRAPRWALGLRLGVAAMSRKADYVAVPAKARRGRPAEGQARHAERQAGHDKGQARHDKGQAGFAELSVPAGDR